MISTPRYTYKKSKTEDVGTAIIPTQQVEYSMHHSKDMVSTATRSKLVS